MATLRKTAALNLGVAHTGGDPMTASIQVFPQLTRVAPETIDEVAGLGALTFRERAVMRLITAGYTSCDISVRLSINPATVETYKQRIQEKLNSSGNA